MKKALRSIILLVVFIVIGYMGLTLFQKVTTKNEIETAIETLPSFSFKKINGTTFTDKDVITNKLIINYFSPDCEHCQVMAQSYAQHAIQLQGITILMCTVAESAVVSKFISDYKLYAIPGIIVVRDKELEFEKIFGQTSVPSFFIYQNKKLVATVKGEAEIDYLLRKL